MKKLKQVKKTFNKNEMKSYNIIFKNRQIKMAYTKVALIFYPKMKIKLLSTNEKKLLNKVKNSEMFVSVFKTLDKHKDKIDWTSFGKLMWFIFQTSTYWKDYKKGIKNIFSKETYVELNELKRDYYHKWLSSIPKDMDNYNKKILKTLQVIF